MNLPKGKEKRTPIAFNILGVMDHSGMTKSLISSTEILEKTCTPKEQGGNGENIGIWADRTEGGNTELNVLGNDTKLIFDKTTVGGNPYNPWNYSGEPKRWRDPDNGIYKFRAYYPTNITIENMSDADNFVVVYNTFLMQKDLLVAYNKVEASTFDLRTPVPLRFRHALAAIRFQVKFKEGYPENDALTSFWLENKETNGLSYIGMMVYGLSETDPEGIQWSESAYETKMYSWEDSEGVTFTDTQFATAYTGKNPTTGTGFTKNDGWLLIIPQKSEGTVTMHFKTKKGGNAEYNLTIPKITGTDEKGENPSGDYYLPGYRYTYTFTLTKTDADVTLSIAPWNQLDSSFEIPF